MPNLPGRERNADYFQFCASCRTLLRHRRICTGCRGVFYCNSSCQLTNWRVHKPFCQNGIKTAPDNELTMSWHNVHEERLAQIARTIIESDAPETLDSSLRKKFFKVSLIERDCSPITAVHNKLAFQKLEVKQVEAAFSQEDYHKWFTCNPPTCVFMYFQYSKFDHIRDPALTITSFPINLYDYSTPFLPLKLQFDALRSEINFLNSFDAAFPNLASEILL